MDTKEKYRAMLGKQVEVVIDRPIGSKHPQFNTVYETNYGYVANTLAGDGKEIDAYVLGINRTIDTFSGLCIAVIWRTDDSEHKLVVGHQALTEKTIKEQTSFIERYFQTHIEIEEL